MRQFHLAEMEYYVDLAHLAWGVGGVHFKVIIKVKSVPLQARGAQRIPGS